MISYFYVTGFGTGIITGLILGMLVFLILNEPEKLSKK